VGGEGTGEEGKERRGREGINIPHSRLKTLAAPCPTLWTADNGRCQPVSHIKCAVGIVLERNTLNLFSVNIHVHQKPSSAIFHEGIRLVLVYRVRVSF